MDTKQRIIDVAIELFNEKGTKAVSTNHIAAAAGISPGNLYYHFRNKEEIIRAILTRVDEEGMAEYMRILSESEPGTTKTLIATFDMIQHINVRYLFFKRELSALFLNDPLLKKQATTSSPDNMMAFARMAIDAAVERGILKDIPFRQRDLLAEEFSLINLFWVTYLDIWDFEMSDSNIRRGSEHMLNLFKPYMTKKGIAETEAEMNRTGEEPKKGKRSTRK